MAFAPVVSPRLLTWKRFFLPITRSIHSNSNNKVVFPDKRTQLKTVQEDETSISWDAWEYGTFNGKNKIISPDIPSSNAAKTKRKKVDPMWQDVADEEIVRGINILEQFVSEERKMKFETVLNQRSDRFRFVFENPANPNNVWAALRTFDAFGIQNVDIILNSKQNMASTDDSGVEHNSSDAMGAFSNRGTMTSALGAQKWLTLEQYDDTASCIESLKKQGYTIFATDIHSGSISLNDIQWSHSDHENTKTGKVAFVMGNELKGISNEMKNLADRSFYIPMKGFAESLNLSVACAVICSNLQATGLLSGNLDPTIKNRIKFNWLTRSVKGSTGILRRHNLQGIEDGNDRVYNSIGSITTKP
jgi:tRNA (guanosine-2'-O-)-methyltransferase